MKKKKRSEEEFVVVRGKRRGREDGEGSDDHEGHVVNVAATNAATGLSEAAAPAAADVSAANAIAALALSEPAKAAGSGTGRGAKPDQQQASTSTAGMTTATGAAVATATATADAETGWRRHKALTVVLVGPQKGQPYRSADFAAAVSEVLGGSVNDVLAFGPLNRNNEWHMTLKNTQAKDRLVARGKLTIKNQHVFEVRPLVSARSRVRVHWAPFYMPNRAIEAELARYGRINSCEHEVMARETGFNKVSTGVRTVTMSGVQLADLPHLITVTSLEAGEKHVLLITVPGRPPLCLRCRQEGHIRKDCVTPFCRHHGQYGHATEDCVNAKSTYSRVVQGTPRREPAMGEATAVDDPQAELATGGAAPADEPRTEPATGGATAASPPIEQAHDLRPSDAGAIAIDTPKQETPATAWRQKLPDSVDANPTERGPGGEQIVAAESACTPLATVRPEMATASTSHMTPSAQRGSVAYSPTRQSVTTGHRADNGAGSRRAIGSSSSDSDGAPRDQLRPTRRKKPRVTGSRHSSRSSLDSRRLVIDNEMSDGSVVSGK